MGTGDSEVTSYDGLAQVLCQLWDTHYLEILSSSLQPPPPPQTYPWAWNSSIKGQLNMGVLHNA